MEQALGACQSKFVFLKKLATDYTAGCGLARSSVSLIHYALSVDRIDERFGVRFENISFGEFEHRLVPHEV